MKTWPKLVKLASRYLWCGLPACILKSTCCKNGSGWKPAPQESSPLALSKHALHSNAMLGAFVRVLIFAAVSPFAHGHALHLFVAVSGDVVEGKTYYADGPAAGIAISIHGPEDAVLATLESDESGAFTWTPPVRCDLRFVTETVDGHRAEFTIAAEELPVSLPAPEKGSAPSTVAPSDRSDASDLFVRPDRSSVPPAELERLVGAAVSREVAPLREQLDAAAHRTQLRDVIGGIGYIVGMAGLFALWKSRTSRSDR